MLCKGVGGSLELLDDRLIIRRTMVLGLLHGLAGEKTIPYTNITAVQFKRAGIVNGYIQFTIAGGNESRKGAWEAVKDENTLIFSDNETFGKARDLIEGKIAPRNAQQGPPQSTAQELEKLASLLDRGLLTRQEFEQQKSVLLGSSPNDLAGELSPERVENIEDDVPSPSHARMLNALKTAIEQRDSPAYKNAAPSFGRRSRC